MPDALREVDPPTVVLTLSLLATFAFGLSGGVAGARHRLDLFGVVVLAFVVGLAGGVVRDLMVGIPPQAFRDWRYITAAALAGLVSFLLPSRIERAWGTLLLFDAIGLSLFCVTGASTALEHHVGPLPAVVIGGITAVGGGMFRDVLLREVPIVLRQDLYAVPALLGATVVAVAHEVSSSHAWLVVGALVCFGVRMLGLRFGIQMPVADPGDEGG